TVCAGSNVTIYGSGVGGYQWSNGSTTDSIVVNPGSTTGYSVTVTNAFGCSSTASMSVNVHQVPASISGDMQICNGEATILVVTGGDTATWSTGSTNDTI